MPTILIYIIFHQNPSFSSKIRSKNPIDLFLISIRGKIVGYGRPATRTPLTRGYAGRTISFNPRFDPLLHVGNQTCKNLKLDAEFPIYVQAQQPEDRLESVRLFPFYSIQNLHVWFFMSSSIVLEFDFNLLHFSSLRTLSHTFKLRNALKTWWMVFHCEIRPKGERGGM